MTLLQTPICDFGALAPDFGLLGVDGKTLTRDECAGVNGLLVMFICSHCPYVKAINHKLVRDCGELLEFGISSVAIMSNDTRTYPEDSYDNMQLAARKFAYPFPYLFDATQEVAKAYGAVCTPDFFGYNADLQLQYRGRLDESGQRQGDDHARRDLFLAMKQVSETGLGPKMQIASMGCSLKWREN
jgi:peroxiredoxin